MAKTARRLTPTELLNRALQDIESVVHKAMTPTMKDALYDHVYSKLEQMEERTRHGKVEGRV